MCTSSKKYGGAVVHKEHVMGSFISTALSFIMATGLTNGMEPAKRHFLMGCKGLTHGCLIIYWVCSSSTSITSFQSGVPVYSVYRLSRKRLLPSKDSIFYDINAVSTCMWFMVNLMTYFMLMSGSDKEQKSFALYMGVTALCKFHFL